MPMFQSIYEYNVKFMKDNNRIDIFNAPPPVGFIPVDCIPKEKNYIQQDFIGTVFEWFDKNCMGDIVYDHPNELSGLHFIDGQFIEYLETYWFESKEDAIAFKLSFSDSYDFRKKVEWNLDEEGRFFIPKSQ